MQVVELLEIPVFNESVSCLIDTFFNGLKIKYFNVSVVLEEIDCSVNKVHSL